MVLVIMNHDYPESGAKPLIAYSRNGNYLQGEIEGGGTLIVGNLRVFKLVYKIRLACGGFPPAGGNNR